MKNDDPDRRGRTRRTSFAGDLAHNLVGRGTHVVLSVAIGVATARIWGADARGMLAAAMIWPTIIGNVFDLGMSRSLPYFIGRRIGSVEQILSVALALWLVTSSLAMIAVAALLLSPFTPELPMLWIILVTTTLPGQVFAGYARGFALGVNRPRFWSHYFWLTNPITLAVIIVGGLILGLDKPHHAWIYVMAHILGSGAGVGLGLRLMTQYAPLRLASNPAVMFAVFRKSIVFGIATLMLRINYQIDILILSLPAFLVTKGDLGNYAIGVAVANILWQMPKALGTLLLGRGASTKDDFEFSCRTASVVRVTVVASLPAAIVLFLIAPVLIPMVYGVDFNQSGLMVQILLPGIIAFFAARIFEGTLNAQGKAWCITGVMGGAALLNITLNILLVPAYGISGAAIASTVCYILGAVALCFVFAYVTRIGPAAVFLPRPADVRLIKAQLQGITSRKKAATGRKVDT
jgi:O-antigen/teichoic acid export membrane protein